MTRFFKTAAATAALLALPLSTACSQSETTATDTVTTDDGSATLAASLGSMNELSTVRQAIAQSELSGVMDGPASYTLLAPNDAAFAALNSDGAALLEEDQRPMLIAVLRDHLLPGHLTPEAIGKSIDANGGPVTMTTLGEATVSFAKVGDQLQVTLDGGSSATISGAATAANNGVVVPIDTVLMPPKG